MKAACNGSTEHKATNDRNGSSSLSSSSSLMASMAKACTDCVEQGDPSVQDIAKDNLLLKHLSKPDQNDLPSVQKVLECITEDNNNNHNNNNTSRHNVDDDSVCCEPSCGPRFLLRVESLRQPKAAAHDCSSEKLLRQIQLQVMLRLQLWVHYGDLFVQAYCLHVGHHQLRTNNKKKQNKKKRNNNHHNNNNNKSLVATGSKPHEIVLWNDVTSILSLAAFQLPPHYMFGDFVHTLLKYTFDPFSTTTITTTTTTTQELISRIRQHIYRHFELDQAPPTVPDKHCQTTTATAPLSFWPSPPVRKKAEGKRKRLFSMKTHPKSSVLAVPPMDTTTTTTTTTTRLHNNNIKSVAATAHGSSSPPPLLVLPKRIQLTAPTGNRHNKLLSSSSSRGGDGVKARFVGSHFNTNLSNMNSLFRQVKTTVSTTTTTTKTTTKTTTTTKPVVHKKKSGQSSCNYSRVLVAQPKTTKTNTTTNTTTSLFPNEPPHHRRSIIALATTATPPPPPQRIVHETPHKRRDRAAVVAETPDRSVGIFGVPAPPQPRHQRVSGGVGQTTSALVAQARRAIQARRK